MYCINSLFEMKYILTSICKHTRYLNCLMYTYIITVFAISWNNPSINNIAGGTVCNLRFYFFCMRSPYPVSWLDRLSLRAENLGMDLFVL